MGKSESQEKLIDLIYFDFDKAASLYSQIEGGIVEKIEVTAEAESTIQGKAKIGVPGLGAGGGGSFSDKEGSILTKRQHHELFLKIEEYLSSRNIAIDISEFECPASSELDEFRAELKNVSYLKTTGWCVIEDFEQLKERARRFNELGAFISRCIVKEADSSHELGILFDQIDAKKKLLEKTKDKNGKAKIRQEINRLETVKDSAITEVGAGMHLDEWFVDGLVSLIDTFLPKRLHIRMYPWGNESEFQVVANLKRDCFVDASLDNTFFSYSAKPNMRLSIFGIITSLPEQYGLEFDPYIGLDEDDNEGGLDDKDAFQAAFRTMFSALLNLEEFYLFNRYPSVTIHPIAVYRQIIPAIDN